MAIKLFYLYFLLLPNIIILNLPQMNLKLFGSGLGAVIIYAFIFLLILLKPKQFIDKLLNLNKVLCIQIIILLIIIVKVLNGNEFVQTIVPYSLIVVSFLIGQVYLKDEEYRKRFLRIIVFNTIIGAVIGILHFHLFPNILLINNGDETNNMFNIINADLMKYRESSTYSNPTVFSHMMAFGYIIVLLNHIYYRRRLLSLLPLLILLFYAEYISFARASIYFCIFISIYLLAINIKSLLKFYVIIPLIFVIYLFLNSSANRLAFSILNFSGDSRWDKWLVGIDQIFTNITTFIIGASSYIRSMPINGVYFSDNNYILQFTVFGITGITLYFYTGLLILKKFKTLNSVCLSKYDKHFVKISKITFLSYMFFGLFSNVFIITPENIYIFTLLGSIYNLNSSMNCQEAKAVLQNGKGD